MLSSHVLGTLAAVLALLTGYGVMQMGNTLQGTLLSVRGGVEGFSPTEIGLVSTGFSLGLMVGSLVAPRLIRRAGHARSFAALASVSSAAALLHLMFVDPQAWMAFRALTGFCFAGLFIAVESWLNGAATPAIRGQILGFYAMTGLLAGAQFSVAAWGVYRMRQRAAPEDKGHSCASDSALPALRGCAADHPQGEGITWQYRNSRGCLQVERTEASTPSSISSCIV